MKWSNKTVDQLRILFDGRSTGQVRLWTEFVIVLLGGACCVLLTGYWSINTHLPAALNGDHLFILANAKSYIDGNGFRFNSDLGFPGQQDSAYFPSFDITQRLILWLGARLISSPVLLVHCLYIIGIAATYACVYCALRWLDIKAWIAAIVSFGFVLSPFLGMRAYGHDYLALYYSVPLGAALALKIATAPAGTDLWPFFRQKSVIAALLIGVTSGLYYAFFTVLFISFLGLAATVAQKRWFPLLASATSVLVSIPVLLICGYGSALFGILAGKYQQPVRFAFEQVMFGLHMAGAAVPFQAAGFFRQQISTNIAPLADNLRYEGVSEWPTLVLTLVILCSPLVAACALPLTKDVRDRSWLLFYAATSMPFGMLYAVRGGLGFLFSLFVHPGIRAPGRIIPFLMFFAVVVLATFMQFILDSRSRWVRLLLPITLVASVLATIPTWGMLYKRQHSYLGNQQAQLEWKGVNNVVAAKGRAGAKAVLELPVIAWPEAPRRNGFQGYDHQAPYVLDLPGSGTQWSYGLTRFQPEFSELVLASENPTSLVPKAITLGFDALLIQKRAYEAEELRGLQAQVGAALDVNCKIYEDGLFVLYSLASDAGSSERCLKANVFAGTGLPETYGFGKDDAVNKLLLTGWSVPEKSFVWSVGEVSTLALPKPSLAAADAGVEYQFDFGIYRPDSTVAKSVRISIGDKAFTEASFSNDEDNRRALTLRVPRDSLNSGLPATIRVSRPQSPQDYGIKDGRILGVQLFTLRVTSYSNK